MRVLHVLNYGWPYIDGYTVRSMGLITAQREHLDGIDPVVAVSPFEPLASAMDRDFTLDGWGPDAQLHATTHGERDLPRSWERPSLGLAPRTTRVFRAELKSIVRRLQPDLIHAHHPHYVGQVALGVAQAFDVPAVYELRCFNGDYDLARSSSYFTARGQAQNFWERRTCRRADTVVTISSPLAERISEAGARKKHVFIVQNSVNTDIFSDDRGGGRGEEQESSLHIGYATSFSHIENLDLIVRAAALANERHNVDVTIAGKGKEWTRIRRLVRENGMEDVISLPGFIPFGRMPSFYRNLDVFVVPRSSTQVSRDTTPLKPLEALACGAPLLASNLPALRELLGGGTDVRFFEPTPSELASHLTQIAEEGWNPPIRPMVERRWSQEVERYRKVYATARRQHQRGARSQKGSAA
jgi:glycosyltransferase involved in cell wall biosynthesis